MLNRISPPQLERYAVYHLATFGQMTNPPHYYAHFVLFPVVAFGV